MKGSAVKQLLERELLQLNEQRSATEPPKSVYDVIRICSPHLRPPIHLDPYVRLLDRVVHEGGVEHVVHAPPQHGKSETCKHALIYLAMMRPGLRHAYSTYNTEKGIQVGREVAQLAKIAGLDPHLKAGHLRLAGGTEIRFGGAIAGTLTGLAIDGFHMIDDPVRDRKDAVSRTIKEDRWNWFLDVAETRRHPGSSVVIMHTRWAQDDLAGRVISRKKWPYLRMPAECDSEDDPCGRKIGEPLWPAGGRDRNWLSRFKVNTFTWAAMYQGNPRPEGDCLFGDAVLYDRLPEVGGYRVGYGADLAYTEKTRADWSVLLKGRMYADGNLYLTDRLRRQAQADKFTALMKVRWQQERGPIRWFGSTTEKGVAQFVRKEIPGFQFKLATADKYVRATPTAELLWNPGKVFVPANADWTEEFLEEVTQFTGMGDLHDDNVDALAALGDIFIRGNGAGMGVNTLNEKMRGAFRGKLRLVS